MLIVMTMLLVFSSCKKNKEAEPIEEPFDITQYVIVEKIKSKGVKDAPVMHSLITFEPQSKSIQYTVLGPIPGSTYTYSDGSLKLFFGGRFNQEFKIADKTIISSSIVEPSYSCQLVKIAASNQLNGNTYSGGWRTDGSLLIMAASLRFTDTHYAGASINLPVPNKEYTLIKNIGAYSDTNNARTLLVLIDGKLEGSRVHLGGLTGSIGAFTKQ